MTEGMMSAAVAAAIAEAKPAKQDGAAVALAVEYARLIDEAAPKATYDEALRVLAGAVAGVQDPKTADDADKALRKVISALSAHSVASDLGPKLAAVLTSLGMTPAGRGVVKGGGQGAPVVGKSDELRRRREQREQRAASSR